jgi:flavin reductase (DIM6/NTAB) family NADH-FMN oxidoreductase RutF
MSTIEQREFRNALSSFSTGVAVVTTADLEGQPLGMTINSFASVSLDPPLTLWSIHKACGYIDEFLASKEFAIHVLKRDQENVSNAFSATENDRFSSVQWSANDNNTPLLMDYCSRFVCTPEHNYDGGDHIIMVGRVTSFDHNIDADPLVFHSGQYKHLASSPVP